MFFVKKCFPSFYAFNYVTLFEKKFKLELFNIKKSFQLTKKVEEIGRNFLNEYFKNSDNSGVMAKSAAGTIACLYLYDWVYHNDIAAGARIKTGIFDFVKSLPYLKEKIRVEIEKEKKELQKSLQNVNFNKIHEKIKIN